MSTVPDPQTVLILVSRRRESFHQYISYSCSCEDGTITEMLLLAGVQSNFGPKKVQDNCLDICPRPEVYLLIGVGLVIGIAANEGSPFLLLHFDNLHPSQDTTQTEFGH